MAADYTFDPGIVFDDISLVPARDATGVLLDVAGGTTQTVYDLNGVVQAGLVTNTYGYIARFKAGIPNGVVKFVSSTGEDLLQPVVSFEAQVAALEIEDAVVSAENAAANSAASSSDASDSASAAAIQAAQAAIAAGQTRNDNGAIADVVADPLRFKRGTPAQWSASTYILADGMPGLSHDTTTGAVEIRVGNGSDLWDELTPITGGAGTLTAAGITDSTVVGRAVLTAASTLAARTAVALEWLVTGTGFPEGVLTAPVGTVYRRLDGVSNGTLYVKEIGTGNTGWKAIGGVVTAASLNLSSFAGLTTATMPLSTASTTALDNREVVVRWNSTTHAWAARTAADPFGVVFLSTNDPAATTPTDANKKVGDVWRRHPDAP